MANYGRQKGVGVEGEGTLGSVSNNNLLYEPQLFPNITGNISNQRTAPFVNGGSGATTSSLALFSFSNPADHSTASLSWATMGAGDFLVWGGVFPGQTIGASGKDWFFDLRPGQFLKVTIEGRFRVVRQDISSGSARNELLIGINNNLNNRLTQPYEQEFFFQEQDSNAPLQQFQSVQFTRIIRLPVSTRPRTLSQLEADGSGIRVHFVWSNVATFTNQVKILKYDVEVCQLPHYYQDKGSIAISQNLSA